MNLSRKHALFVQAIVSIACCLLPSQEGFGQGVAKIDLFIAQQQSYAVIDISGDSTSGVPVTLLALGDDNHAAFAFNTMPELHYYDEWFGYYYLGDCVVKLWSNGALTDGHTFPLTTTGTITISYNMDPSLKISGPHNFLPSFITTTGTVFGSANWDLPLTNQYGYLSESTGWGLPFKCDGNTPQTLPCGPGQYTSWGHADENRPSESILEPRFVFRPMEKRMEE